MTTIHATGTSTSSYPAQRATVTAHLSVADRDRPTSVEQGTSLHNRIVARAEGLRESGDASWHSAEPITTWARKSYDEGTRAEVIVEHITSSRVSIKLSNLERVSGLVTELALLGASTSVEWALTATFRRECERDARRAAVGEARIVAEDYAAALGERIDRVVSISDSREGGPGSPMLRMAAMDVSGVVEAEVTVPEISVSATVSGVFESA